MSRFEGYRLGDVVWIVDSFQGDPYPRDVLFVMRDGERIMVLMGGLSKVLTENAVFTSESAASAAIKELMDGPMTREDLFLSPSTAW